MQDFLFVYDLHTVLCGILFFTVKHMKLATAQLTEQYGFSYKLLCKVRIANTTTRVFSFISQYQDFYISGYVLSGSTVSGWVG